MTYSIFITAHSSHIALGFLTMFLYESVILNLVIIICLEHTSSFCDDFRQSVEYIFYLYKCAVIKQTVYTYQENCCITY